MRANALHLMRLQYPQDLACASAFISPISSRKIVPPFAASNAPSRAILAPVNAPRSCPKSSLSSRESGMAAQLIEISLALRRRLEAWSSSAINSLPLPVSPVIRTLQSVAATRGSHVRMCRAWALLPIQDHGRHAVGLTDVFQPRWGTRGLPDECALQGVNVKHIGCSSTKGHAGVTVIIRIENDQQFRERLGGSNGRDCRQVPFNMFRIECEYDVIRKRVISACIRAVQPYSGQAAQVRVRPAERFSGPRDKYREISGSNHLFRRVTKAAHN